MLLYIFASDGRFVKKDDKSDLFRLAGSKV